MFLADKLNKGGSLAAAPDSQFNYVTMLLHGDGTNGAQNNTFLDGSTNNFTITRNGTPTQGSFSPYGSNWSNYFNGSSGLTAPSASAFDLSGSSFTIQCWMYMIATSGYRTLICKRPAGGGPSYSLKVPDGTNSLAFGNTANEIAFTGSITYNSWMHIAIVCNGTNTKLYMNGVYDSTVALAATSNNTDPIAIGGNVNNGNEYMTGYISNMQVLKGVQLYSSNFTPPTAPATAISGTSLLTCQSNRFIDNSTNNFTITASGSPSVQRFNPFGASTAYSTSVIGGSGYFQSVGSFQYLQVANNTALQFGTGDFTVEGWFYMTGATFSNNCLFSIGYYNSGMLLRYVAAGTDSFYFNNAGYNWNPSTNFRLNQWNHVAVVRNGTTVSIYVNGTSVFSVTNSSSLAQSTATSIGTATHDTNNECCLGYISDFRMVKGTAVYTSNFTPPTAPLTAITNTSLLTNMTNGAIFDNAMMNDLETVGNAQISTSVVKYGTGSMYFDGAGDYLVSNSASTNLYAFGTGDFTIEFWIYTNSSGTYTVYDSRASGANDLSPTIYLNSNAVTFFTNGSDRINGGTLTNATWNHIALARSGTSTKLFLNGTQTGSTYTDTNNYINSSSRPFIGAGSIVAGQNPLNGYIDDLRITKGYARYTTTFTPPTAAFPNTGPT